MPFVCADFAQRTVLDVWSRASPIYPQAKGHETSSTLLVVASSTSR
jgi:hypothetical protein